MERGRGGGREGGREGEREREPGRWWPPSPAPLTTRPVLRDAEQFRNLRRDLRRLRDLRREKNTTRRRLLKVLNCAVVYTPPPQLTPRLRDYRVSDRLGGLACNSSSPAATPAQPPQAPPAPMQGWPTRNSRLGKAGSDRPPQYSLLGIASPPGPGCLRYCAGSSMSLTTPPQSES